MKFLAKKMIVALLLATPAAHAVSIVDAGYATAQGTAYVVKLLLADQTGAETKIVPVSSVPVIWEGLNRNNGEIDIWTDVWLPNQDALVAKYAGAGKNVTLAKNAYAGTQGYCTLTATAEAHNIHSVYDLTDPDKAKVFAPKGSERGQIWLGAAGWLSTNYEEIRARTYGFAPFFDLTRSDEAVATAALDNAAKTGGAWIGYCYAPHQNYVRYKLTNLQEPEHNPATWQVVDQSDPDWLKKSRISTGYGDAAIHIAYSNHFAQTNPDGVKIVEAIHFNTQDVSALAYAIAVEGKTPEQAARGWLDANKARVADWLSAK